MPRGSPGPGKRAKRVPPVPTPQVGTATAKAATLAVTASIVEAVAIQTTAERPVIVVMCGGGFGVRFADQRVGNAIGHGFLPDPSYATSLCDKAIQAGDRAPLLH